MIVATVIVSDAENPVELQSWLDDNPNISIFSIMSNGTIFYILYSQ